MFRKILCGVLLISPFVAVPASHGQSEPTHVCPHFSFGQTEQPDGGTVYHWYAEYLHHDSESETCTSLRWDSYNGGENETTGGNCQNLGSCIGLKIIKGSQRSVQSSPKVARRGLTELPDPDDDPVFGPTATVVDKKIVDVMITPTKVIKVKLYLILVDPRVVGKPLPPIFVTNGFEVKYDPEFPPYLTVPNHDVSSAGGANFYHVKIGQVEYRVITQDEG